MHGHLAHTFEDHIHDRTEPPHVAVLVQGPGRRGVDVLVQMPNEFPQGLQGARELEVLELGLEVGHGIVPDLQDLAVDVLELAALRHHAFKILVGHGQAARKQVAQIVGQVCIEAAHQGFLTEGRILPEAHLREQKIAEGAQAVLLGHVQGRHHVPQALGHLGLVDRPVPVHAQALVQRDAGGHEHGRPEYGVRLQDVLGHQMVRPGPVGAKGVAVRVAQSRDIVNEGVEPDIGHEIAVERQLNTPGQPGLGPGDAQVAKILLEHGEDLVAVALGLNEIRVGFDVFAQRLQVLGHAEEVVLFLDIGWNGLMVRTFAVHQLLLGVEALATKAVVPAIFVEIDISVVVDLL